MFVEQESSAWPERPGHLGKNAGLVRDAAQHQARDNDVDGGIRHWQFFGNAGPNGNRDWRGGRGCEGQPPEHGVGLDRQHARHSGRIEGEGGPVAGADFDDGPVGRRHEPPAVGRGPAGVHARADPGEGASEG